MHKSKYLHRFLSASVHCIHLRVKFRDYYKMRLTPKNDQMLSGLGNVSQVLVLLLLLVAPQSAGSRSYLFLVCFNKVPEADSHICKRKI